METVDTNPKPKKQPRAKTEAIRVDRELKKQVLTTLAQLNKKTWGKRITVTALIKKALTKLEDPDFIQLESETLTNKDRFEQKYHEYCKSHGRIERDAFLGIVISGAVKF